MGNTDRSATPTLEHRTVPLVRADGAPGGRSFAGHAVVYGQRTAIGNPLQWGFYEVVQDGACDRSIAGGDVVMLADHDPSKPIARQSAGTLSISSDVDGVAVSVPSIPATSYGDDLVVNLDNRNVAGMSFGFYVREDVWTTETVETNDGMTAEVEVRTLVDVDLVEVSTTAFPAYVGTDAGLRSAIAAYAEHRPAEQRVGATISAATKTQLQAASDSIAAHDCNDEADGNLAAASDVLVDLMGINDGEGDTEEGAENEENEETNTGFPVDLSMRLFALKERERNI